VAVRSLLSAVVASGLAACSGSPAAGREAASPPATRTAPATSAAPPSPVSSGGPSPVSATATVTGTCAAGVDDLSNSTFYPMTAILGGSGPAQGDEVAEAYQLTLTDTSSTATAQVTGFAVVFYDEGQELTSDSESLDSPTFITPGQALTWTEYPWGTSTQGDGASVGPFAAGIVGAVDSAATCKLLQWYS
jgi:hypothetical protein